MKNFLLLPQLSMLKYTDNFMLHLYVRQWVEKFCSGNGKKRDFDVKEWTKKVMKNTNYLESNLEPHWVTS